MMRKLSPLPLAQWPTPDRSSWIAACNPRARLFDETGAGAGLRPKTRTLYLRAYSFWLQHLTELGELDPGLRPSERVTPALLDSWIASMRAAGRIDSTIRLYLVSLHSALRLLDPLSDTSFILKPHGTPLSRLLPSKAKPFPPVDTEDVMGHIQRLHSVGIASNTVHSRRTCLRDAALLALFVHRAPRVAIVAGMRLGLHLTERADGRFFCQFSSTETKTGRRVAWFLDDECAALMRDYLRIGRPLFDGAMGSDALWLGNHGSPLEIDGIAGIFCRRTTDWFGQSLGPHTARKWLRSTAARRSPEAAFDAAEVLGHTPQVSLKHYAQAQEVGAGQRHADHLRALRRRTEGLAARLFADAESLFGAE